MRKRERDNNHDNLNSIKQNKKQKRTEVSPSLGSDNSSNSVEDSCASPVRDESSADKIRGMLKCNQGFNNLSAEAKSLKYLNTAVQNKGIANIKNVAICFVDLLGDLDKKIKDPNSSIKFIQDDQFSDDLDVKFEMECWFQDIKRYGSFKILNACLLNIQDKCNKKSIQSTELLKYATVEMLKINQNTIYCFRTFEIAKLGFTSCQVESEKFCDTALGVLFSMKCLRVEKKIYVPKVLQLMILDFARMDINKDNELQK